MRLNKTQTALLRDAADNSLGRVCVISGMNTARRIGQMAYGARKADAAIVLAKAGLLTCLNHGEAGTRIYRNGWCDHSYERVYEITEAGRQTLKT